MTSPCERLAVIAAAFLLVASCVAQETKAAPIPAEVRCDGDDALTMRLKDKLETAFKLSPYFSLSGRKNPGTLVVTIPDNVGTEPFGIRTWVVYSVVFSSTEDQPIGKVSGACWDDKLAICAGQIMRSAEAASRKLGASEMHSPPQP